MIARILLTCAFGLDIADMPIDYLLDGKVTKVPLVYLLRRTFSDLTERMSYPRVVMFPFLTRYHLSAKDREFKTNAMTIRKLISQIVEDRRK